MHLFVEFEVGLFLAEQPFEFRRQGAEAHGHRNGAGKSPEVGIVDRKKGEYFKNTLPKLY
jgi:hypothetical protein